MAEVIRDVIINIRLKQLDSKLKAPDTKAVTSAIASVNKEIESTTKVQVKASKKFNEIAKLERAAAKQRQEAEKELQAARKKAAKEAEENAKAIVEGQLKAAGGFKSIGDGALKSAESLGKLFITSDEGLKEFTENLEVAKNAFDLYKGGLDIVKGAWEVFDGLATASKAAAAANAATAASNTAVATTATTATVATRGLMAALGPIGIALAAAGAAYAAYVAWQKKSVRESQKEAKAEWEKAKALKKQIADRENAARSRKTTQHIKGIQEGGSDFSEKQRLDQRRAALKEVNEDSKRLLEIETRVASQRRKANAEAAQFEKREEKILRREESAREFLKRPRNVSYDLRRRGTPFITTRDKFEGNNRGADSADAANAAIVEAREHNLKQNDPNRILETEKRRTAELKEQRRLHNASLSIIDRQRASQKQQLETAHQQLKTARELVKTEEARVKSVEASIHRLDPRAKARLKALSAKAGRGEKLTDQELEEVRASGSSSKTIAAYVEREQAKRGRKDAESITSGFADKNPDGTRKKVLRQGGSELSVAQRDAAAKQALFNKTQTKTNQVLVELDKKERAVLNSLETIIERTRENEKRILEITNRLDEKDLQN